MGRARILANLAQPANYSARYLIEIDLGAAAKTAALARLTTLLATNDLQTAEVLLDIAARAAEEGDLRADLEAQQAAYIAAVEGAGPDTPAPDIKPLNAARLNLSKFLTSTLPLRMRRDALLFERKRLLSEVARWNAFQAVVTQSAWCDSFPPSAGGLTVGAEVATVEVNGVQGLSFVGVGGNVAASGRLVARQAMTPEQVFFNAAILPGWQKFKPIARTGVVTGVNLAAGTVTVDLDEATSTPIRLDINQSTALQPDTPVTADAYIPGDAVVVAFGGQDWDDPVIWGWVNGPQRLPSTIGLQTSLVWFDEVNGGFMPAGDLVPGFNNPALQNLPTYRVTRLNPTAVAPVPDATPDAVHLGSATSLTRNFADDYSGDPRVVPQFPASLYYPFPRSFSPTRPSVSANHFGFVAFDVESETWGYLFEVGLFVVGHNDASPLNYPRSYVGNLIEYTQTTPSGTASGAGFASRAAAIAHLNANYDPVIDVVAEFPNGQTVALVCRKNGVLFDVLGGPNVFNIEIVSCTPSRIVWP